MITGRDAQPDPTSKTAADIERGRIVGQLHTMNQQMRDAEAAMAKLSPNTPAYDDAQESFEQASEAADECIALLKKAMDAKAPEPDPLPVYRAAAE